MKKNLSAYSHIIFYYDTRIHRKQKPFLTVWEKFLTTSFLCSYRRPTPVLFLHRMTESVSPPGCQSPTDNTCNAEVKGRYNSISSISKWFQLWKHILQWSLTVVPSVDAQKNIYIITRKMFVSNKVNNTSAESSLCDMRASSNIYFNRKIHFLFLYRYCKECKWPDL